MFGGPWLAVVVFVVVAIGLGWGLISLFNQQLESDRRTQDASGFSHDFALHTAYTLNRDLLLGYMADGRVVLLPGRSDLPAGTPGRRSAVSLADYREKPADYPDLIGIVEADTRVQFVEIVEDPNNPQTRLLVTLRLLDGPYARQTPVLGMHLESVDNSGEGKRYTPRADLFTLVEATPSPIQSSAPDAVSPDAEQTNP
jgi:hypothetical protein